MQVVVARRKPRPRGNATRPVAICFAEENSLEPRRQDGRVRSANRRGLFPGYFALTEDLPANG